MEKRGTFDFIANTIECDNCNYIRGYNETNLNESFNVRDARGDTVCTRLAR